MAAWIAGEWEWLAARRWELAWDERGLPWRREKLHQRNDERSLYSIGKFLVPGLAAMLGKLRFVSFLVTIPLARIFPAPIFLMTIRRTRRFGGGAVPTRRGLEREQ